MDTTIINTGDTDLVIQDEQETGIYKVPPSVKKKPRKPPKQKNQSPKPHRDAVVRKPREPKPQLDPNISPRTGKPKRKYVRRTATTTATPVHAEELQEILPVQEDVSEASPLHHAESVVQPTLQQTEPACTRQAATSQQQQTLNPSYLYQLSKRRAFKLVTRQEQGERVPAQYHTDAKGNKTTISVPAHIQHGRTVLDGQCSKCRVFSSGRIPIYYTTYETSDGVPLPYLCGRCVEQVALYWWNADKHDDVVLN